MDIMALASLSKSLLSRMSISSYPNGTTTSTAAIATPTMGSSEVVTINGSAVLPISVGVGRRRDSSGAGEGDLSSLLIGSFSPIRNMELYPPRVKVIEEGCTYQEVPFALLSGENVEYMGRLDKAELLYLTNYRLLATHRDGIYSVPIGMIEGVEVQTNKETLTFLCRDARIFRLGFASHIKARSFHSHMLTVLRASFTDHRNIFAYVSHAYRKDLKLDHRASRNSLSRHHLVNFTSTDPDDHRGELVTSEYLRMGMGHADGPRGGACRWRISQCNCKYDVCATYPKLLIVPNSVSDLALLQASKFRMMGRLPVVVWRHPVNGCVIVRASQPLVGMLSWRSSDDEKLLSAVSRACATHGHANGGGILQTNSGLSKSCDMTTCPQSNSRELVAILGKMSGCVEQAAGCCEPQLVVMDLRSYTVTLGNRAKGGGSECADYYSNCDIRFKGLPNIHSVRKSFQQLRAVLAADDQVSFLSNLESTQWLSYICELLAVACEVVSVVHDSARPILIHCSDGWDRTTQVVALAELMLDPYYRTMEGFRTMLEREWLAFGHKFGDRCGHTCDDSNQRCPVFLQWLDSVHQLMRQHPCDFEFNEHFLVKLGRHAYSCFFGTFLGNSMKEREVWRLAEDSTPIWELLHKGNNDILNFLYKPPTKEEHKVLRPIAHIHRIFLWRGMYCTPVLCPYTETSHSSRTDFTTSKDENSPKILDNKSADCVVYNDTLSPCRRNGTAENATTGNAFYAKQDNARTLVDDYDISLDLESDSNHSSSDESNDITVANTLENGQCNGEDKVPTSLDAHDELVESLKNQEFHESLHMKMSVSAKATATANGSISIDILPSASAPQRTKLSDGDSRDSPSQTDKPHEYSDQHFSTTPHIYPPASRIEMHPIKNQKSTSGGHREGKVAPGISPGEHRERNVAPRISSGGHREVAPGISPGSHSEGKVAPGICPRDETSAESTSCSNGMIPSLRRDGHPTASFSHPLDADGLPCNGDLVHARLKEIASLHSAQIKQLTVQLQRANDKVSVTHSLSQVENLDTLDESQSEKESPSSLAGWECVDGQVEGLRWIPDHAVNDCCGCGERFWTAKRKHHCRSCGQVFCGLCSDYYCPVPQEQLFVDVRVCEKCFYKLDGHLKQQNPSPNLGGSFM